MARQVVKRYVKTNKSDRNDADDLRRLSSKRCSHCIGLARDF